jgi:hypothetical protein
MNFRRVRAASGVSLPLFVGCQPTFRKATTRPDNVRRIRHETLAVVSGLSNAEPKAG